MYDPQKLLMASTYDGDGNRAFQLNYNTEAECGYGKNVSGEIFMPEHSTNEDGSLTAEGELFGYICSATGRAYDLTEYVNDTNREYAQVLMAYNINTDFDTESYAYAGNQRLSRNNIWNEARDVNHDEMSYYLYDGRGSVTANTWYNGMVTDVYQYDPYGQVTLGSTKYTDFYGYNAESYNPNTGLEYLRARYYNAEEGRFFQEDTNLGDITDPLTLNRYAYVKNSPLNYVDPSGHEPIDEEFLLRDQCNETDDAVLAEIADAINGNLGALGGAAAGMAIVVMTAPASVPTLMILGAGMQGAGVGLVLGGLLHKGMDSAMIAHELKKKYGIDFAQRSDLELDELPQEAQELCERLDENTEDMETYLEAGLVAGAMGQAVYEAGALLSAVGATVAEKSKNAFQNLKRWFNQTFRSNLDSNLLDDVGKFTDDVLENNYQAYVNRKISKGQTPKNRLEWKKASDYWSKESPVARGNNFNKTVREAEIYDYHEVYLENGKRLDSYDPDAGEIISRKATDLDKISEKTYRGYLTEFSQKYSEGTKIRSNAYPELDGQALKGQYILEIPASNANIKNIDHYKRIAAEYDVIIRFTEEVQ